MKDLYIWYNQIVIILSKFMLKEFKQFLLRGNVVDLAVGVVIGTAFGAVVNALVADFLTPLIGALGRIGDFGDLVFTINGSEFKYGHLLNSIISFILIATAVFFFVVKPMNILIARAKKNEVPLPPSTKKCPQCLSEIPIEAKRCAHCVQMVE